jgi:hypothetical protein
MKHKRAAINNSAVILRSGFLAASRRMVFSSVLAAILRGSGGIYWSSDGS